MLYLLSAGSNAQGQLGNTTVDDSHIFRTCSFAGVPPETLPPNAIQVLDIANGSNHTLVLLEVVTNGDSKSVEVWGCGDGRKGQLGPTSQKQCTDQEATTMFQPLDFADVFDKLDLTGCVVAAIGATWETSYLALTRAGKHDVIVSFGSNEFGDLGIGDDENDKSMEKGAGIHIVDFSRVFVDGLPITSSQTIAIEMIRTGQRHVMVSMKICREKGPTQVLVGWGACRHGQLGDAPTIPRHLPNNSKKKGSGVVSQPPYYSRPTVVMFTNTASDLVVEYSLGIQHSVFLHASGRVSARGSNRKNQTQGLDDLQNICDIKCTWNGTYALTAETPPRILSTGSNSHGQLGKPDDTQTLEVAGVSLAEEDVRIKSMVCGSEHLLVCLSADGREDEVWGWGWNEHGNLGVGNTIDSPIPLKIWPSQQLSEGIETHTVRSIWAGNGSSWILCGTPLVSEADKPI